jgi:hypothetical protein
MRPGVKKGTCNGVSSPVSSEMLAIRSPHSVLIPTAVTWRKNTGSKKKKSEKESYHQRLYSYKNGREKDI